VARVFFAGRAIHSNSPQEEFYFDRDCSWLGWHAQSSSRCCLLLGPLTWVSFILALPPRSVDAYRCRRGSGHRNLALHLDTAYEYRCSGIAAGQQGEVAQVGDGIFGQGQVVRGEVEGGGGGELNQGS
jgi:hypothetical protein